MINNFDLPKTKLKDDKLGYSYLAYHLAKIILKAKPTDNSFVIGVCGKWGDGKTTLINYIKKILIYFLETNTNQSIPDYRTTLETIKRNETETHVTFHGRTESQPFNEISAFGFICFFFILLAIIYNNYFESKVVLFFRDNSIFLFVLVLFLSTLKNIRVFFFENMKQLHKNIINNLLKDEEKHINEIVIIDFNPWHYQKQEDIIINFFKVLSKNLAVSGFNNNDKLVNNFMQYASLLTGIKIPKIESDGLNINEIKTNIYNELFNSKIKFLVIIDDLDRLQGNEAFSVFKSVKLLADFPNIIYLLSYDDERLSKQWPFQNENYIQKIVQLEKKLPIIFKPKIKEIFINKIQDIIGDEYVIDKTKLTEIFDFAICKLIKNIRDINRFENSFRLTFSAHENVQEVYMLDFILISILEEFDKNIYCLLQENEEIIFETISTLALKKHVDFVNEIKKYSGFFLAGALFSNYFTRLSEIFDGILKESNNSTSSQDVPRHELSNLLPIIKYKFLNFKENDTFRRICDKSSFENYFMPNVSSSLILDNEFNLILEAIKKQEEFNSIFRDIFSINQDKIKDFNKRFSKSDFINDKDNMIKFITSFFSIEDKVIAQLFDFREFCENQLSFLKQGKLITKNELINVLENNAKESNIIQLINWYHELNMQNIDEYLKEDLFNPVQTQNLQNIIANSTISINFEGKIIAEILIILGIHQIKPSNMAELKIYFLENETILKFFLERIKVNTSLNYEFYFQFEDIQDCLIKEFIKHEKSNLYHESSFCRNIAIPILSDKLDKLISILKSHTTNAISIIKNSEITINNYKTINESMEENLKTSYINSYQRNIKVYKENNIFDKFFAISQNELVLRYLLIRFLEDKSNKNSLLQAIKENEKIFELINSIETEGFDYQDKIKRLRALIDETVE